MLSTNGIVKNDVMVSGTDQVPTTSAGAGLDFGNLRDNACPDTTTDDIIEVSPDPPQLPNGLTIFTGVEAPSSAQTLLRSLEQPVSSGQMSPGGAGNDCMPRDVIRHLAVDNDSASTSPLTSPGGATPPVESSLCSPDGTDGTFHDLNTQLSLVERSEHLQLDDPLTTMDSTSFWRIVSDDDDTATRNRHKVLRRPSQQEAVQTAEVLAVSGEAAVKVEQQANLAEQKVFDPSVAVSSSQYIFTKFGSDVPIFTFGTQTKTDTITHNVITSRIEVGPAPSAEPSTTEPVTSSTNMVGSPASRSSLLTLVTDPAAASPIATSRRANKASKEVSLNTVCPPRQGGCELKILVQPEAQHRARYMTEGSRGTVKDESQEGHPKVKLYGYKEPIALQVFVGTDTGKVKPHGFYQACKVCGKNSTPCSEVDVNGTTVIKIQLTPEEDMTATIDCVGILKLRNADVEQRIGLACSKKKSTKARLVFRVALPKADGGIMTLQVASTAILCTQPAGQPEICRKSLSEWTCDGGEDLFIIGKNFSKNTTVMFREEKDGNDEWATEVPVEKDLFQPGHLICKIPPYKSQTIESAVHVNILVKSAGRQSEPQEFIYWPVIPRFLRLESLGRPLALKLATSGVKTEEVPMEMDETKSYVSPVAVMLNKQFQEASQASTVIPSVLLDKMPKAEGDRTDIATNLNTSSFGNSTSNAEDQPPGRNFVPQMLTTTGPQSSKTTDVTAEPKSNETNSFSSELRALVEGSTNHSYSVNRQVSFTTDVENEMKNEELLCRKTVEIHQQLQQDTGPDKEEYDSLDNHLHAKRSRSEAFEETEQVENLFQASEPKLAATQSISIQTAEWANQQASEQQQQMTFTSPSSNAESCQSHMIQQSHFDHSTGQHAESHGQHNHELQHKKPAAQQVSNELQQQVSPQNHQVQSPLQSVASPVQSPPQQLHSPIQQVPSPLEVQSPLPQVQSPVQQIQSPLQVQSVQSPLQQELVQSPIQQNGNQLQQGHSTLHQVQNPIQQEHVSMQQIQPTQQMGLPTVPDGQSSFQQMTEVQNSIQQVQNSIDLLEKGHGQATAHSVHNQTPQKTEPVKNALAPSNLQLELQKLMEETGHTSQSGNQPTGNDQQCSLQSMMSTGINAKEKDLITAQTSQRHEPMIVQSTNQQAVHHGSMSAASQVQGTEPTTSLQTVTSHTIQSFFEQQQQQLQHPQQPSNPQPQQQEMIIHQRKESDIQPMQVTPQEQLPTQPQIPTISQAKQAAGQLFQTPILFKSQPQDQTGHSQQNHPLGTVTANQSLFVISPHTDTGQTGDALLAQLQKLQQTVQQQEQQNQQTSHQHQQQKEDQKIIDINQFHLQTTQSTQQQNSAQVHQQSTPQQTQATPLSLQQNAVNIQDFQQTQRVEKPQQPITLVQAPGFANWTAQEGVVSASGTPSLLIGAPTNAASHPAGIVVTSQSLQTPIQVTQANAATSFNVVSPIAQILQSPQLSKQPQSSPLQQTQQNQPPQQIQIIQHLVQQQQQQQIQQQLQQQQQIQQQQLQQQQQQQQQQQKKFQEQQLQQQIQQQTQQQQQLGRPVDLVQLLQQLQPKPVASTPVQVAIPAVKTSDNTSSPTITLIQPANTNLLSGLGGPAQIILMAAPGIQLNPSGIVAPNAVPPSPSETPQPTPQQPSQPHPPSLQPGPTLPSNVSNPSPSNSTTPATNQKTVEVPNSSSLYSLLTAGSDKLPPPSNPPIQAKAETHPNTNGSAEGSGWRNTPVNRNDGSLPAIPVDDVDRLLNHSQVNGQQDS